MKSGLPVRPIPIAGESPAGILMRAVERNGYPNLPSLIWAIWKLPQGRGWAKASYLDPDRYEQIIDAMGIKYSGSTPAFVRNGPTSESARILDGMVVPEKLFRDDGRFYCPECLKEHAFWRKTWALRPFSVCPKHRRYLRKDCPACGARLEPWRGKLLYCECGADLSATKRHRADPAVLNWWIECHRQADGRAQVVDALLLALTAIDGGDDEPRVEHMRLCAAHDWLITRAIHPYLRLIDETSKTIHPRIQLLPLLRSQFVELKELAQEILRSWVPNAPLDIDGTGAALRTNDAECVLGVSTFQFKKFKTLGLVKFPDGRKARRGEVSLDAINRILFSIQAPTSNKKAEGRKPTGSLARMVLDVMSRARSSAGYDIAAGLQTLRLVTEGRLEADKGIGDQWMDVGQISALLGTYPDAVRFLARKKGLEARDRDLAGRKRLIAKRSDVERFNRRFIFASVLARALKMNPTNLAEKLMSLGAQPVSGLRVDGALLYLFRRADVKRINIEELRALETYETIAGRPKGSARKQKRSGNPETISIARAATCLGLKQQQVQVLVRKGVIKRVERLGRAVHVTKRSVERLRKNLARQDTISIDEAAAQFNQSPRNFKSLWISTGILRFRDWGLWRRIPTKDLERLQSQLHGRVTASEGGRMFSMHRSYLPNLERQGAVNPVMIGSKRKVKLYEREDLRKLRPRKIRSH